MLETPNVMNTITRSAVNKAAPGRPPLWFCPRCGGLHHAPTGMTDRTGRVLRRCVPCQSFFAVK